MAPSGELPRPISEDDDLTPDQAAARSRLVAEIRRVFPATRPRLSGPLVNSRRLDDELRAMADAFADATDWTRLDAVWFDRWYLHAAPSFLSDEAMCFYLPAFMVLKVTSGLEQEPSFSLWHGFDAASRDEAIGGAGSGLGTWNHYARARWAGLTREQAGAVVSFLEYWITLVGPGWDAPECRQALDAYWIARAGDA